MSQACSGGSDGGAIRRNNAAVFGAADGLALAASPIFAIMALLTAVDGSADMMCIAAPDASLLSGMVPMYMLMSAIHSAPWLKLVSGRRRQP
jgi:hypothetical protein